MARCRFFILTPGIEELRQPGPRSSQPDMLCSVLETREIRLIKSRSRKPGISLIANSVARTCFLIPKTHYSGSPGVGKQYRHNPLAARSTCGG